VYSLARQQHCAGCTIRLTPSTSFPMPSRGRLNYAYSKFWMAEIKKQVRGNFQLLLEA